MGNSNDDETEAAAIPSWQRTDDNSGSAVEATAPATEEELEIARSFLDDDQVKNSPRKEKVDFLKTKGLADSDIQKLLGSVDTTASSPKKETSTSNSNKKLSTSNAATSQQTNDRAPIVTYPEFLTKPQRPPPLVTTDGLFSTLYAFAGLSTLVYGASKYLVAPMVHNLNQSRFELHETASHKLQDLILQLEKTVSVVPLASQPAVPFTDNASDESDDPAEMFHRDVGTQTSFPAAPTSTAANTGRPSLEENEPAPVLHATQLAKVAKSLSSLRDDVLTQSSGFEGMKTQIDALRDELDGMTYAQHDFTAASTYEIFGAPRKSEPNDEIRKVRDSIRRIKGLLLSTRNFPASTK